MPQAIGSAVFLATGSYFVAGAAAILAQAAIIVGSQLALDAAMRAAARREAESCRPK